MSKDHRMNRMKTHSAGAGVPLPNETTRTNIRAATIEGNCSLADEGLEHNLSIGRAAIVVVDRDVVAGHNARTPTRRRKERTTVFQSGCGGFLQISIAGERLQRVFDEGLMNIRWDTEGDLVSRHTGSGPTADGGVCVGEGLRRVVTAV